MQESSENYLETILLLKRDLGKVRAIDIAKVLNYSKPSVSRAISILRDEGMIEVEESGEINFTQEGKDAADQLLDKHETLTTFLMMTADVSQEIAESDACRMEHYISNETYRGIQQFIKDVQEYHK